jgi:hypothetical protein
MVDLKVQEKPYFVCGTCGYQDFMGNTECCPICDPEEDEKQDLCYFIDIERELCRQDGNSCPFVSSKEWDNCPKLEGMGSKK